jgi:hypothetical protein
MAQKAVADALLSPTTTTATALAHPLRLTRQGSTPQVRRDHRRELDLNVLQPAVDLALHRYGVAIDRDLGRESALRPA